MYMSSPVLVNGRVVGLSHKKRGQYFALDPATGAVEATSEPGQGENAAFVMAAAGPAAAAGRRNAAGPARRRQDVRSRSGGTASPTARPTRIRFPRARGILIRDETGLSLYGTADRAAAVPENQP